MDLHFGYLGENLLSPTQRPLNLVTSWLTRIQLNGTNGKLMVVSMVTHTQNIYTRSKIHVKSENEDIFYWFSMMNHIAHAHLIHTYII